MEAETEQVKLEIPVALQVVAWLMILTGGYAVLGMLFALAQGNLFLSFKFLYLFVGIGLLKLRSGWWICALVFLAIGWIACALAPLAALLSARPFLYRVLGTPVGCLPKWTLWVTLPEAVALLLFQTWVLLRPGTRRLFDAPKDENTVVKCRTPGRTAFWIILLSVLGVAQAWYWEQQVTSLSDYFAQTTPFTTASGSIYRDDGLIAGYGIVRFPSGKYGVAIVARSKGGARITRDLAREGLARIWIDKTLYEFPFSGEDDSDGMVTSILEKALEKHRESQREKVDKTDP